MHGRVSTLLSLGVGFNRKLTGRQNVVLGGLAAGLTRDQLAEKYDEIVDFAELEDFMDMPMRTYSSGMYGRLAFAVAVTMDPDILLIDEALSVGDARFRRKSFERMRELCGEDRTILLVSHALGSIEELCDEAIWMHKGELRMWDEPDAVVEAYTEFLGVKDDAHERTWTPSRWRTSDARAERAARRGEHAPRRGSRRSGRSRRRLRPSGTFSRVEAARRAAAGAAAAAAGPSGSAPLSTVPTEPGSPSSQKRRYGIGRWSPAVSGGQAANAGAHARRLAARCRSAYSAPSRRCGVDALEHVDVPRQVGDRQRAARRIPAAIQRVRARPAREQRPAGDGEPVEEREQDGRRAT